MLPANKTSEFDTIFALSSGTPPAAIAIVRISGPKAGAVLDTIAGRRPVPRVAALRTLHGQQGETLDHALVLWFPGPRSATGEDLAELHLHGGRAVVDIVLRSLRALDLRLADPGEFTRRSLSHGRIDLSEAEGLADLLSAQTEAQRREAIQRAGGALSRRIGAWVSDLLTIAARLELLIDYDGEEENSEPHQHDDIIAEISGLRADIDRSLSVPPAERLRHGLRIVITGPPNAGKSTLFNALVGRNSAIVSDIPGTTRDVIEVPIALKGMPFILIDTAGLRHSRDPIEQLGMDRARDELAVADIILSLGEYSAAASNVIQLSAKADIIPARIDTIPVSAHSGHGMDALIERIAEIGAGLLPLPDQIALDAGYREVLSQVSGFLQAAYAAKDMLLTSENIRIARELLDKLTGRAGIEDMLDALFQRFCVGK